ncbi:MAG: DUF4233 domain-containing protein [Burkholderiaceae bacterium]|nr:DUF4233 domain-containing protein [Microbacteriaceae bacterium]
MRGPVRRKSAIESLLSIVLVLEALLVFFLVLVVFALKILPSGAAFGGGAVLFLLLIAVSRSLRHGWAVWAGWTLQVVLIATGFLEPFMFVIGIGFAGLWTYCFVTGRKLDRRNAPLLEAGLYDTAPSGGSPSATAPSATSATDPDSTTDTDQKDTL